MNRETYTDLTLSPQVTKQHETLKSLPERTLQALARQSVGATAAELLLNSRSIEPLELDSDVEQWANESLLHAVDGWNRFSHSSGLDEWTLPQNISELKNVIPDIAAQITRVHNAAQASDLADETSLLLVPYGAFYDNLPLVRNEFAKLRAHDKLKPDYITAKISRRLINVEGAIFDYLDIGSYDQDTVTFKEYLRFMAKDGAWGVVGLAKPQYRNESAKNIRLTRGCTSNTMNFRGFGLFEWMALTFQNGMKDIPEKTLLPGIMLPMQYEDDATAYASYDAASGNYNIDTIPGTTVATRMAVYPMYNARA